MDFNLLDYHVNLDDQGVIMYYKGPFDEVILSKVTHYLREQIQEYPIAGKRLFAIFIELAQNIAYYSVETNHFAGEAKKYGIGTIVIQEDENTFKFTAGNLILNEKLEKIREKCDLVNQLSQEELRELKKKLRAMPRVEGHPGGNIGLIQVALKADRPLELHSSKLDEERSFFSISTEILK